MGTAAEHAGGDQVRLGDCAVRVMVETDIAEVMKIEERAYEFPWTAGIFRDCIRAGYCCYVLERKDGALIAYAVMSVGAREAHILNVCVAPLEREAGYGAALMAEMIALARRLQADMMFLEVRPSNEAALHLYQKLGFNEIGTRSNYYPAGRGREDALILAKQL